MQNDIAAYVAAARDGKDLYKVFRRCDIGKLVRRDVEGILEGLSADGMVTLKSDDGDYTFPAKAAGYVKLCDDEDLF